MLVQEHAWHRNADKSLQVNNTNKTEKENDEAHPIQDVESSDSKKCC